MTDVDRGSQDLESDERVDDNDIEDESVDDASRARQQKLAAMREYRERTGLGGLPPGTLTSLYLKERRALRRLFPGTLADLARDGIIKARLFGEDGWRDVPDESQSSA